VVWFLCNGVSTVLLSAVLLSAVLLSAVLAAFATAVGAGPDKLVVLVLDNAGWHSSEQLVVPDGLRLAFLPPYSPELQPAERLWPLTNEAVANRSFATLKELDEALGKRCCTLAGLPELSKRRLAVTAFRYSRQPRDARPSSSRAATARVRGPWSGPRPCARARR
jgi:hypothetical protein